MFRFQHYHPSSEHPSIPRPNHSINPKKATICLYHTQAPAKHLRSAVRGWPGRRSIVVSSGRRICVLRLLNALVLAVVPIASLEGVASGLRVHGVRLTRRRSIGRRLVIVVVVVLGVRRWGVSSACHPTRTIHRSHPLSSATAGLETSDSTC